MNTSDHITAAVAEAKHLAQRAGYDTVRFLSISWNEYEGRWEITLECTDAFAANLGYSARNNCAQGYRHYHIAESGVVPCERTMGRAERELRALHSATAGLTPEAFASAAAQDFARTLEAEREAASRALMDLRGEGV